MEFKRGVFVSDSEKSIVMNNLRCVRGVEISMTSEPGGKAEDGKKCVRGNLCSIQPCGLLYAPQAGLTSLASFVERLELNDARWCRVLVLKDIGEL